MLRDVLWLIGIIFALSAALFGPGIWVQITTFDRPEIVVAAIISVCGISFASVFGYFLWLQQHDADKQVEKDRQAKRRRSLMIALRAEIGEYAAASFAQYGPENIDNLSEKLTQALEEAEPGEHSMPMSVVIKESIIFDNLKSEITDLPKETLPILIRYKQASENTAELLTAFSSGQFEPVSLKRKKNALNQLFLLGKISTIASIDAFEILHSALELEEDEAFTEVISMKHAFEHAERKPLNSNDNNGAKS